MSAYSSLAGDATFPAIPHNQGQFSNGFMGGLNSFMGNLGDMAGNLGNFLGNADMEDWGSIAGFGKDIFEMYGANKMLGLYEDKLQSDQDYASLTAYNTATLTDDARKNQSAQAMNMQNPGSGDWGHLSDPAPIRYSV